MKEFTAARDGRPLVVVVAGPNGAGKSTTAPSLLQDALAVSEFVNADAIAAGLSAFRPESMAVAAGRLMLGRIRALAMARVDFAFETTLASKTFAPRLKRLRESSYRFHLAFLSLPSPDLAVARVAERVRLGGHDVPEAVIRRRFVSGLRNLFGLYLDLADTWQVFDNSTLAAPRLIAARMPGEETRLIDADAWRNLLELSR
ncbi:MAG: AAA family ATPase [Gemmatimonadales bacterium]|nr:AAA family ATPase [Gemmatimonadales bacterium]